MLNKILRRETSVRWESISKKCELIIFRGFFAGDSFMTFGDYFGDMRAVSRVFYIFLSNNEFFT